MKLSSRVAIIIVVVSAWTVLVAWWVRPSTEVSVYDVILIDEELKALKARLDTLETKPAPLSAASRSSVDPQVESELAQLRVEIERLKRDLANLELELSSRRTYRGSP